MFLCVRMATEPPPSAASTVCFLAESITWVMLLVLNRSDVSIHTTNGCSLAHIWKIHTNISNTYDKYVTGILNRVKQNLSDSCVCHFSYYIIFSLVKLCFYINNRKCGFKQIYVLQIFCKELDKWNITVNQILVQAQPMRLSPWLFIECKILKSVVSTEFAFLYIID